MQIFINMSYTDIRIAAKLKLQEGLSIVQILHPLTESDDLAALEASHKNDVIESGSYEDLTPDGTNYISQMHSDMEHSKAIHEAFDIPYEDRAALLIALTAYAIELLNNKDAVAYFYDVVKCTTMMLKAQALTNEDLANKYLKTSADTTIVTLDVLAKALDIEPLVSWTKTEYATAISAVFLS